MATEKDNRLSGFLLDALVEEVVITEPEDVKKDEPEPKVDDKQDEPKADNKEPENQDQPNQDNKDLDNTDVGNEDAKPYIDLAFEVAKFNGFDVSKEAIAELMGSDDIEGVANFINAIVEENKPSYADPEVEELNEFIANGGTLKQFYEAKYTEVDYTKIDLDTYTEAEKKQLVKEYHKKTTKLSEARINSIVDKLDETELDETSKEALDALKKDQELNKKTKEESLKALQEERKKNEEESRRKQKERVDNFLETQKAIAGFELNKIQKDGFNKFLHEQSVPIKEINPATGKETGKTIKITPYQKMVMDRKNIDLELAYIAYLGLDKNKLSKFVESDVSEKIRQNLSNKKTDTGASNRQTINPDIADPKAKDKKDIAKSFALGSLLGN